MKRLLLFTTLLAATAAAQDFTSPALPAITSWMGNSYGGAEKWVQALTEIAGK